MEIICFYFYRFLRPGQYRRHFEELREAGVDSIIFNVDETETIAWHEKELKRACCIAHDMGLKMYMGFCRFGGVFAGDRLITSGFAYRNPQTHVVDKAGVSQWLCCVNSPDFREWYFQTAEALLGRFDVDGVWLDEPKGIQIVCHCPTCRDMASSDGELQALRLRSIVNFLEDCCRGAKRLNPRLKTMIVAMPSDRDLMREAAMLEDLDVLGSDPYWIFFRKDFDWLREQVSFLMSLSRTHGKQSQLWAQSFQIPMGSEQEVALGFDTLASYQPDQLCTFYDIIQNDDPDAVWAVTKEAIRRIKSC